MGSIVFGHKSDDQTANCAHDNTNAGFPGMKVERLCSNSAVKGEFGGKEKNRSNVDGWDHEAGGTDELKLECFFDIGFRFDSFNMCGNEGAN